MYKNEAKELRAITKGGAIEKNSNIAIAILELSPCKIFRILKSN